MQWPRWNHATNSPGRICLGSRWIDSDRCLAASLTNGEIARVCGCVATGFEKKTADTMSQDVTSDAQSPRTLASMLKLRELELPTKMTVFTTVVASFQHVPTAVRKLPGRTMQQGRLGRWHLGQNRPMVVGCFGLVKSKPMKHIETTKNTIFGGFIHIQKSSKIPAILVFTIWDHLGSDWNILESRGHGHEPKWTRCLNPSCIGKFSSWQEVVHSGRALFPSGFLWLKTAQHVS